MVSIVKKMGLFIASFALMATILSLKANPVSAANAGDWRAGNIIDDSLFYNGNDMSASEIQAFLNSKLPSCDTWGTKSSEYGGGTRAQYGASRGYPAPYTCLKDYSMNIPGYSADSYCGAIGGGTKSSAQIIRDVASACGIGSKVLIVLLQKEQSLVTDEWPWPSQYQKATGFACPDTAPCDAQYAGFFNQVYRAARQYKIYRANASSYRYKAGQNNYVLWNVESTGCGGGNVYIENYATAGLYIYTPYQPNQAALNNLYGTGDGCSAYGNRNFWRMYTDWFGSVRAQPYVASAAGQSDYPTIRQGQASSAYMRFKNVGAKAWYDETSAYAAGQLPVRLGTDLPVNRESQLGGSWPWRHRAAINFGRVYNSDGSLATNQHVVQPGQTVEFWFAFTAPPNLAGGKYLEGLRPIVEGYGPMNDTGTYIVVTVQSNIYQAQFSSQSAYPTLKQGQKSPVQLSYKNTGDVPWYDQVSVAGTGQLPVQLATDYPLNRTSQFSGTWPYPHRAAVTFGAVYESNGTTLAANQHVVQPGQIARFNFDIKVPFNTAPGFYGEALRPIVQGLGPMNDTGTWMGINVERVQYTASAAGQSAYPTVARGGTSSAYMRFKNTGNIAWYDDSSASSAGQLPVKLGTDIPLNRMSEFGSSWPSRHRAAVTFGAVYESNGTTLAANQHVVQPGQIADFWFAFTTPSNTQPGKYLEGLRPIVEGYGPMNDTGTYIVVTVN